jgi:hypothetical protein
MVSGSWVSTCWDKNDFGILSTRGSGVFYGQKISDPGLIPI